MHFPGLKCGYRPSLCITESSRGHQVHDLDKNPTLDIDFPTGRLRLRGTYVHPEGKFLSLQPKGKRIVAQDVFEQIVVFSEHVWLGPADKDPTGSSATVPNDAYKMLHTRVMYEGGASCGEEAALGKVGKGQLAGQQSIAGFFSSSQDDGDGGRVRRAAAQNIKYRDGDEFDDGDDDDEDEEDEAEVCSRPTALVGASKQRKLHPFAVLACPESSVTAGGVGQPVASEPSDSCDS